MTLRTLPRVLSSSAAQLAMVAAAAGVFAPIHAAEIPDLYSTGFDAQGQLLAPGAPDGNYTLNTSQNAIVAVTAPGAWNNALNGLSQWIAPAADATGAFPAGTYSYKTTFDLTQFDITTASISGVALADDGGEIFLNGQSTGQPTSPLEADLNTGGFLINSGFRRGENELEFRIVNGDATTPTGLRVQLQSAIDPDLIPPEITSVKLAPAEVYAGLSSASTATVSVIAADWETGIDRIEATLTDPDGFGVGESITESKNFGTLVDGNVAADLVFTLPPTAKAGLWTLHGIAFDGANNYVSFTGGVDRVPEGVVVKSTLCESNDLTYRTGPFPDIQFGQFSGTTLGYEYISNADLTALRYVLTEMKTYDGWNALLQQVDYNIYFNYCEIETLKTLLRQHPDLQWRYDLAVNNIKLEIDRAKAFESFIELRLADVKDELLLNPNFVELLDLLIQSDARDFELGQNQVGSSIENAKSIYDAASDIAEYLRGVAKVTPKGVIGLLKDIYGIVKDGYEIFQIVFVENAAFENYGDAFMEFWNMHVELQILLDQYNEQIAEYEKVLSRVDR